MKKIVSSLLAVLFSTTIYAADSINLEVKTAGDSVLNTNSMPYQSISSDRNMSVENDTLWKNIYSTLIKGANAVDKSLVENGQDIQMCSLHRIKSFNDDVSKYDSLNQNLPQIQDIPTAILNVNTFYQLNKNNQNQNLTTAYIPSVFASELLMKKPYNPDSDLLPNSVSDVIYSQNIHDPSSNLRQNWTSVSITQEMSDLAKKIYRAQGRTPALDAANLREATIRDLTTVGYVLATNPKFGVSSDDFLKSAMVTYSRNKFMCVYEAENLMLTVF